MPEKNRIAIEYPSVLREVDLTNSQIVAAAMGVILSGDPNQVLFHIQITQANGEVQPEVAVTLEKLADAAFMISNCKALAITQTDHKKAIDRCKFSGRDTSPSRG